MALKRRTFVLLVLLSIQLGTIQLASVPGTERKCKNYRTGISYPLGPIPSDDPCSSCECTTSGFIMCRISKCRKLTCPTDLQIKKPEECCGTCPSGCTDRSGTWVPPGPVDTRDPCRSCTCIGGTNTLRCSVTQCGQINCPYSLTPEKKAGECCPKCPAYRPTRMCFDPNTGEKFGVGPIGDRSPCKVRCTCQPDGVIKCAASACVIPECAQGVHPEVQAGDCCPTCPNQCKDERGKHHAVGLVYTPDPCKTCACDDAGNMACQEVKCKVRRCNGGFSPVKKPGSCCPSCPENVCTDFLSGLDYPVGPIPAINPCMSCRCTETGAIQCSAVACPVPTCPEHLQIQDPNTCCATCPLGCLDNDNNWVPDGSASSKDHCKECSCDARNSVFHCREKTCVIPECPGYVRPITPPGECCPSCPITLQLPTCIDDKGVVYRVGKIFPHEDGCQKCYCSSTGDVKCFPPFCPKKKCSDDAELIKSPGDCCPTCQKKKRCTDSGGTTYNTGDDVPSEKPCRRCWCLGSGDIECKPPTCPPVTCPGDIQPEVAPGHCCPTCPVTCTGEDGTLYRAGEDLPTGDDPCHKCFCGARGSVICPMCPIPYCPYNKDPIRRPGDCCLTCP